MKKTIQRNDHNNIDVEYDETRYNIEFYSSCKEDPKADKIIIRRLKDDKIIRVFDGNIAFIYQTYISSTITSDSTAHYVICSIENDGTKKFNHYIESDSQLWLEESFNTYHIFLDSAKVGEKSFIISEDANNLYLYNFKKKSNKFTNIYTTENLWCKERNAVESLGENILMVTMSKKVGKFEDKLTFGINPDTFKIVTPIWSEIQERVIPIYTDDQVMEYAKTSRDFAYYKYQNHIEETTYDVHGNVTIEAEVTDYLKSLNNKIKNHDFVEICSNIKTEMEQSNTRKREPQKNPKKN